MKITIFVKRRLRVVHHHPHLQRVSKAIAKARPHLAQPHEHHFNLTVGIRVEKPDREKDLLLLHEQMDAATKDLVDMGEASFERICLWVKGRIPDACVVRIDELDEGCEIQFDEDLLT